MADQFIGLTVYLTLKDAQQTEVRGLVADVIGQELGLRNGRICMFRYSETPINN